MAFGTTCRFFSACICGNVCCQTANLTRQASQKMKREEKTATLSLPWILKTPFDYTVEAVVPGWQQLLPVWTCLSTFFSSWGWLTTLTTYSALFQHIMMWLMCVDEQRMSCGAMLSIMHRWAKPRLGWAVLCLLGSSDILIKHINNLLTAHFVLRISK